MLEYKKLVDTQDEYISLLVKEIESMISIAYVHGWRSDNHEAGSLLREKIASLKEDAAKAEQEGPWKYEVVASWSDTELGRELNSEYVTISDGKVTLFVDCQEEDMEGEKALCDLLNRFNIKIDYNREPELIASQFQQYNKELYEEIRRLREQEGLKWVKVTEEVLKSLSPDLIYPFRYNFQADRRIQWEVEAGDLFDITDTYHNGWDDIQVLLESAPKEARQVEQMDAGQFAEEIDRRTKIIENNLKLEMRLNMPGISEADQEFAWQQYKVKHNL